MKNQIVIKHYQNGMSIGGVYYAIHEGPSHPDVTYINDAQVIESMPPCLCYGSYSQAKARVMETAQRVASITGARIVDLTQLR